MATLYSAVVFVFALVEGHRSVVVDVGVAVLVWAGTFLGWLVVLGRRD